MMQHISDVASLKYSVVGADMQTLQTDVETRAKTFVTQFRMHPSTKGEDVH